MLPHSLHRSRTVAWRSQTATAFIYTHVRPRVCNAKRAMEFTEAQADWWKDACDQSNNVDFSRLLPHTDAASVALLQTELYRCLLRRRCSACGRNFTLSTSLGHWHCHNRVTGQPQGHHRIDETDLHCQPQQVTFLSWQYELLVYIGALSACNVPGRVVTQNSGQTEQVCISRTAVRNIRFTHYDNAQGPEDYKTKPNQTTATR